MKVTIEFYDNNTSFWDESGEVNKKAVAAEVHDAARQIHRGRDDGRLFDARGNYAGKFVIESD